MFRRKPVARAPLPSVLNPPDPGRIRPEGQVRQAIETGRNRLVIGGALFALAYVVIGLRLLDLAIIKRSDAEPKTARADIASFSPVDRADIVDRNGVLLATSLATASLYANPYDVLDPAAAARALATVLPDMNPADVAARLRLDRQFVWLRRNLAPQQEYEVNRLGIPGLYFQKEERRIYPHGPLTAHTVGFTDIDNHGLAGVERKLDDVLRKRHEPLQLSLDIRVQHIMREELAAGIARFTAEGGAGLVLDARNGEIISLVSLPDFDGNNPATATPEARFNRVTLGAYEMGSTFKLFTAAMALDMGKATLRSSYDASRPIEIGRFTITDYHAKNRWLTVPEILIYSSNIGAARMAVDAGTDAQRSFLGKIGMLRAPTIEISEVAAPLVPSPWREINTMTIAFGHGLSVTPMQLAAGAAAIVNGGILRPTTLLKRPDDVPLPGARVISARTSDEMRTLMRMVVTEGTGKNADAEGYPVGGKTGTAEKAGKFGYKKKALLSSFVAAFPINDPRYLVVVIVDEPHANKESHGYATAGWTAAPVVREVVRRMAPLLGIEPWTDTAPVPPIVNASLQTAKPPGSR